MEKHLPQVSLSALGTLFLLPTTAIAHAGVDGTTGFGSGFSHPLVGVDHLLAMVAVGFWAVRMGGRAVWVVPGAFVTLMILGGILSFSGISVPFIDQGILVSVLVIGFLIAGAFRFPVVVSGLIVGFFAVFHGHSHGTEIPLAVGAATYSTGFALSTALLHAVGMAAGVCLQKRNFKKVDRFAGGVIVLGGIYLAVS